MLRENFMTSQLGTTQFLITKSLGTVMYPGGKQATVTLCIDSLNEWVRFDPIQPDSLFRRALKQLRVLGRKH